MGGGGAPRECGPGLELGAHSEVGPAPTGDRAHHASVCAPQSALSSPLQPSQPPPATPTIPSTPAGALPGHCHSVLTTEASFFIRVMGTLFSSLFFARRPDHNWTERKIPTWRILHTEERTSWQQRARGQSLVPTIESRDLPWLPGSSPVTWDTPHQARVTTREEEASPPVTVSGSRREAVQF